MAVARQGAEVVARQIIGDAVRKVFDRRFPHVARAVGTGGEDDVGPYSEMIAWFADGGEVLLSDEQPFDAYERELAKVPGLLALAATYARLGQTEEAKRQVAALRAEHPDSSLGQERRVHFHSEVAREHWIGALELAGLPE